MSTPYARTAIAALLAGLLVACASGPAPRGDAPAPGPGTPAAPVAPASPLAAEQRWMQQLFEGTPVAIDAEPDGSMRVEVPMPHAFDGDKAAPKPALKAVLDKLALSMFRQPRAQLHIGAPGPAARERLQALRTHMTNKGLPAARLLATAPRHSDAVLLRLAPGPSALPPSADRGLPAAVAFTPPAGR